MRGVWAKLAMFLLIIGLTFGCRTSRPEVKPPPGPEVLNVPPSEARFNQPVIPAQAFKDREGNKLKGTIVPDLMNTRGPGLNANPGMMNR